MRQSERDFITLLKAYANGEKADITSMNLEEIYEISNVNNLVAVIFTVIKDELKDEVLYNKFNAGYFAHVMKQTNQRLETNKLIERLNAEKIEHILIKGIVMCQIYTPPELRGMGDIDIIIEPSSRKKVDKIFAEMGYKATCEVEPVYTYAKNKIEFEIHSGVVHYAVTASYDIQKNCLTFLKDIWNNKEKVSGYTYVLNKNYDFIFLLLHLLKHFDLVGTGARFFLDITLYIHKYELDFDYINSQIEFFGLTGFVSLVFALCNDFFGLEMPKGYSIPEKKVLDYFADYSICKGIFGKQGQSDEVNTFRHKQESTKNLHYYLNFIKLSVNSVCPGIKIMRVRYPILKKLPFLLPIYWIKRVFEKATLENRFGLATRRLLGININKNETKKQTEMFKKIGL
ncbi:MAG: nucleotidyltransferase family protein [Clostridia bacterium]